ERLEARASRGETRRPDAAAGGFQAVRLETRRFQVAGGDRLREAQEPRRRRAGENLQELLLDAELDERREGPRVDDRHRVAREPARQDLRELFRLERLGDVF